MLRRLPIALAKVQANDNLLNEIRQIIYSLYQAKEITKKVYNNMMDSIIIQNMLMNSENSKTSEPDRLLLNLADKINLKGSGKYAAL